MMSETSIAQIDAQELPESFDGIYRRWTAWCRTGLTVSKILIAGLLVAYLLTWAQDLHRLHTLKAEPSPPSKVISKYEVWNRIQALSGIR
ncbi:MAG: hypothetical protein WC713_13795 [Candidatus Methylomirabilota bacterium]